MYTQKRTDGANELLNSAARDRINTETLRQGLLAPCEAIGDPTAQYIPNHIKIWNALHRLEETIDTLSDLKNIIIGEDVPEVSTGKHRDDQPCLITVLMETGDKVEIMADDISRLTTSLRDILL